MRFAPCWHVHFACREVTSGCLGIRVKRWLKLSHVFFCIRFPLTERPLQVEKVPHLFGPRLWNLAQRLCVDTFLGPMPSDFYWRWLVNPCAFTIQSLKLCRHKEGKRRSVGLHLNLFMRSPSARTPLRRTELHFRHNVCSLLIRGTKEEKGWIFTAPYC